MAKRGRPKVTLANASVATLERALARRKRGMEALATRRDALRARLAKVEAELAAMEGAAGAPVAKAPKAKRVKRAKRAKKAKRRGPRPGRKTSLAAVITKVLEGATKPMRAAAVTSAVLAAGYETKAKNFKQIVHSALTRHPDAARAGTGLYVLKGRERAMKGTAPAKKAGNGRRRAKKKTGNGRRRTKKKAAAT